LKPGIGIGITPQKARPVKKPNTESTTGAQLAKIPRGSLAETLRAVVAKQKQAEAQAPNGPPATTTTTSDAALVAPDTLTQASAVKASEQAPVVQRVVASDAPEPSEAPVLDPATDALAASAPDASQAPAAVKASEPEAPVLASAVNPATDAPAASAASQAPAAVNASAQEAQSEVTTTDNTDPGIAPPKASSLSDDGAFSDDDNNTPCVCCHFSPTSPADISQEEPVIPVVVAVDHQIQMSAGLLQQQEAVEAFKGPKYLQMVGVTLSRADMDYYMIEKPRAQRRQGVLDYIASQTPPKPESESSHSQSRSSGYFSPATEAEASAESDSLNLVACSVHM
jgi:hypothetical protein